MVKKPGKLSLEEWDARRERRNAEIAAQEAEFARAEAPLVEELNAAGFAVESAWDLVNTSEPYPDALPILVDHVQRPYPGKVREGIARALAVPDSRFAWDILTRLYRAEPDNLDAKHGLAVALAVVADSEVIDEVIALLRDKRHGTSRGLLLGALDRSKDPRATAALMELGDDPVLAKEIQIILRRRLKRRKR